MVISLKHSFTSPKSDGPDSTLVQPSNWNAEHTLTMATARLIGRTTAGTGAAEEISVGSNLSLSSTTLNLASSVSVTALTAGSVTISGGSIDGTAVGATTASTGRFTTLTTTGAATPASLSTSSATISGGTINGTSVGATTPSTGAFTTLSSSGTATLNAVRSASYTDAGGGNNASINGFVPVPSVGQVAFFGIGAYATALLTVKLECSPWLGLSAAVLLPAGAGWGGFMSGRRTTRWRCG